MSKTGKKETLWHRKKRKSWFKKLMSIYRSSYIFVIEAVLYTFLVNTLGKVVFGVATAVLVITALITALICKYRCKNCVNTKRLVSMKTESNTNNSRCWWIETTDKRVNQLSTIIWEELMNWSSRDKNLRNIQAQHTQRRDRGHL